MSSMNPAQQEAVSTRVPNVLVSAGAGSGKTRVLTQRYLDLLEHDGLQVEQILTLTFTRKAALEMRERISRALEAKGMVTHRRAITRAPIGTIHSFCERVLREHALQAGIDPNFRLLDDAEARTLQENTLDTIFEDVWRGTQQEREEIGRLILDQPQLTLRSALLELLRTLRTQGMALDALRPPQATETAAFAQVLTQAVEELLDLPGTVKWEEAKARVRAALEELRPLLVADFSWEQYYRAQELLGDLTPAGGPKELAKAARDAIKAAAADWLGALLDGAAQPYLHAFLVLLARLQLGYSEEKARQGLLDFEDLLLLTRDLLVHREHGDGAAEHFRRRFRQVLVDEFQDTNHLQFSIIRALQGDGHLFMVGDVKQSIYRFIGSDIQVFLGQQRRIAELAQAGQRIPMHANYRTRPEVLHPLNALFARLWAEDNGFSYEALEDGLPFPPKATPAVEMAFWPYEDENADALRDRETAWIARRILQLTGGVGEPALTVTEMRDEGPVARPATFGDVIILFRASSDIQRHEDALRRAGIPFYVVSGRGFYQSREVQDLVHMLRVLDNPLDDFSLAVVLRSPLVGACDDTLYWLARDWTEWSEGEALPAATRREPKHGRLWENIERLETLPVIEGDERQALLAFRSLVRQLQEEMTAGQPLDLIDHMLTATQYAASLLADEGGDQRYANVQKLREVAATFQARGIFDLADFQRYLTQLETLAPRESSAPLEAEGSNVVRLMTIHAAKGLEAPIVFLADCGREPVRPTAGFLFSPHTGLACKVRTPDDEWVQPAAYQQAVDVLTLQDRREAERLLYVAMTRAREHLICTGFTKYPERAKCTRYADVLAHLLDLSAPLPVDTAVQVDFDGHSYPVQVWCAESLAAVEALAPPAQEPTLWEAYGEKILAGAPLAVGDEAQVDRYRRVIDRLQPLPASRRDGPLRVGVSRALCYATCPRQYWFRHLLHAEEAPLPQAVEDDPHEMSEHTDGTAFGKLMHAVLELADFTQPLLPQVDDLLIRVAGEKELTAGPGDRTAIIRGLERLMATPVYPVLQRARKLYRELRFLTYEGGIFVPGIIDVLAHDGDDWWVIDYKTGHPAWKKHQLQVGLYALGVEHTLRVRPAHLAVVYLEADDPQRAVLHRPVDERVLTPVRETIQRVAQGLRREEETVATFAPTPGEHCRHCTYLPACADILDCLQSIAQHPAL